MRLTRCQFPYFTISLHCLCVYVFAFAYERVYVCALCTLNEAYFFAIHIFYIQDIMIEVFHSTILSFVVVFFLPCMALILTNKLKECTHVHHHFTYQHSAGLGKGKSIYTYVRHSNDENESGK